MTRFDRSNLFAYQKRAIDFIKDHQNCALFVEPGLGKTVSAATAFLDLQESFAVRKMLVVAPLRVARKTWPDELACWSHLRGFTYSRIIGDAETRLAGLNADVDAYFINQENVAWLESQFFVNKKQVRKWPFDTVVIDESQGFRNQSSQRFKALKRLRPLFSRCIELTGTPAPNGLGNLWSQIFLLDGGKRLGRTESAFRDRWFWPEQGDGYVKWHIKDCAPKQIQDAIADIVLSLRVEDYFQLPPVIFNPVRIDLSPAAMQTYRRFAREYIAEVNQKTITAASAGVLFGRLAQLANGSIYTDDKGNFELFHDEKVKALLEVLDGVSGPVVIGYNFRADAARIAQALTKFCGREKRWAMAEEDSDLEDFAQGRIDYLLVHPASAGHGLNSMHMSGSTTIVHFGFGPNLEWYQQLNARLTGGIRRVGKSIVVHNIVADGTVDDLVLGLLTDKAATQDDLTKALVKHNAAI